MTQEEKAKCYDEALKVAKKLYEQGTITESLAYIFPELKELGDEKTRKRIIALVNAHGQGMYKDDMLAWLENIPYTIDHEKREGFHLGYKAALEKQGESYTKRDVDDAYLKGISDAKNELEKQGEHAKFCDSIQVGDKVTRNQDGMLVNLSQLERVAKPADKVEPKFHEGEWITNGDYTWKIVEVKPLDYILQSQDGNIVDDTISHVDEQFHSFTIEDAKTGDVLIDNYNNVVIYQEPGTNLLYHSFCYVGTKVFVDSGGSHFIEGTYPATKEQRNLLFQKMKEAGYEWDGKNKELKKIEQESTKNEELTEFDKAIGVSIGTWNPKTPEQIQSVKSLSNKLLKLAKKQINDEQKPAWSEEDKVKINRIVACLENLNVADNDILLKDVEWLKSIKDRLQPKQEWSEEDKEIIDVIIWTLIDRQVKEKKPDKFKSEINWLKSLRP